MTNLFKCVSIVLATLAFSANVSAEAKYTPGEYQVDITHSKVGFDIAHLVVSSVEGRFTSFDSTLKLSDKFEKSQVKATVDMKSVDTGTPKRDDHLRGNDFFDVAKYPKMTFVSKEISGTPEAFKLKGDLTIKGVTKPVVFEGKMLGSVADPFGQGERVVFAAKTTIKRADFGLTYNKIVEIGPVIGESLTVDLKIEGLKPETKKK